MIEDPKINMKAKQHYLYVKWQSESQTQEGNKMQVEIVKDNENGVEVKLHTRHQRQMKIEREDSN